MSDANNKEKPNSSIDWNAPFKISDFAHGSPTPDCLVTLDSAVMTANARLREIIAAAPTVYLSGRTWTEWKYPKESHKAKLIMIEELFPDKAADKNCRELEAGIVDDEFIKDTLA